MSTPDIFAEITAAGEEDRKNEKFDLGPISRLADKQFMLERKADTNKAQTIHGYLKDGGYSIKDVEESLKLLKKDLNSIKNEQIPEIMKGFRLKEVLTDNDYSLKIKKGLNVFVKDENKLKLFDYLRKNGAGNLVKNKFSIDIKNEDIRTEIVDSLDQIDCDYKNTESVHPQTLTKFVRDKIEGGKSLPNEIISFYEYSYTNLNFKK